MNTSLVLGFFGAPGPLEILILLAVLGLLLALVNPNARKPILITLGTLLVISVGAILLIGFLRALPLAGHPTTGLILVLFALAGIALFGLVALIVNPKTRPWGIGLAIIPLPLVIVFAMMVFWVSERHMTWREVVMENAGQDSQRLSHRETHLSSAGVPVEAEPDRHASQDEGPSAAQTDAASEIEPTPEETPATEVEKTAAPADETAKKAVTLAEPPEETANKTTVRAKPPEEPASPPETTTAKRPAWIDAPPGKVGDVYRMTVNVGPYETRLDCDRQLPERLRAAADDYVDRYLGPEAKGRVRLPTDYLEKNTVRETWEETREYSVGPMTHLHVLLEFDRKTNDLIKQQWRDAQVRERIVQAGTALGGVLSVLLVAFGLLKFDLATGGAYRKHMAIGAILLLLALVVGWAGFVALFYARQSDGMAERSTRSVSLDWQPTHAADGAHVADSRDLEPPPSKYSESANSARDAGADESVTIHSSRMRVFNAAIFLPLGCLAILLVAFRKTRLFGVGLLLLSALAMGALVMVA